MGRLRQLSEDLTPFWVAAMVAVVGCLVAAGSGWAEREVGLFSRKETDATTVFSTRWWAEAVHRHDLLHGLELTLFDWRVRQAADSANTLSPKLRLVLAGDSTIQSLRLRYPLGEVFGVTFPRQLYARVLRELGAQGTKVVAFDVLLSDDRPDHPGVSLPGSTNQVSSDGFFADQIAAHGRVVLGTLADDPPTPRFRNVAYALGGVDSPRDIDGSARRVRTFVDCRYIGSQVINYATKRGLYVELDPTNSVHLIDPAGERGLVLPVTPDGQVELPMGGARISVPAFEERRVWHMGIVLAAEELGLDLASAKVGAHQIVLTGTNGVRRVIATGPGNTMMVDWSVTSSSVPAQSMEHLLYEDMVRQSGRRTNQADLHQGKLVVFGSVATGSNLADIGPTPLAPSDFLVSTYVNVANSLLLDRMVRRWPPWAELGLQLVLSLLAAGLTWRLRLVVAELTVLAIGLAYLGAAIACYVQWRLWVPIVCPLVLGLALNHAAMLVWRVFFEQKERQRVRSVFSRIVAPEVVQELLKADHVGLGGARRKLTVFFADVRGFTEMTDRYQAAAEEHVRRQGFGEAETDRYFEQQAREVLDTVNLYLATIADVVKAHKGTLDKYIGDCVMAFWGAPASDPRHAVNCVLAAIAAQRAVHRLNDDRAAENARREEENKARAAAGGPLLPLLQQLSLGTGINTGTMTVGLMGSDAHILNYTVFGREVNLASRLEGVSGRSRIIVGHGTYEELLRHAPELAALCVALEPVTVKGFRDTVRVYEVPWRQAGTAAAGIAGPRPWTA